MTGGLRLLDYGARHYAPLLGRFISPDTIVPEPGNPQSLNRYSYVGNRPLVYTDPSGYAPQDPNDADDNPAACATDWCWQNRWYRAHGYSWNGSGWSLMGADAHFYDIGILLDTMGELGIQFADINAVWTFAEMTLVAQGVVALANRIGSFAQLNHLLPHGARFWRTAHALFYYLDPAYTAHAHTFPGANVVVFADSLFQQAADFVRGTAVHELAHLIDYFNPFPGGVYIHQVVPKGTHISDYAVQNNLHLEYWAEMVTDWVYGSRYSPANTKTGYKQGIREALNANQADWLSRVLMGWGW